MQGCMLCPPCVYTSVTLLSDVDYCSAVLPTCMCRLSNGMATALRVYSQTQAAFEDTSAFSEIKSRLSVR